MPTQIALFKVCLASIGLHSTHRLPLMPDRKSGTIKGREQGFHSSAPVPESVHPSWTGCHIESGGDQPGINLFFFFSFFCFRFSLGFNLGFFFCSLLPLSFFPLLLIIVSPFVVDLHVGLDRFYPSAFQ